MFGGVRSDTRKNGAPPMKDKEVLTEAEELRRQSSLLSTFEEIAQTFLSSVSGERGNGKVFTFLQEYLDGSVLINGAYCSRRTVLLAIHDMKGKQQAPPALQSKTLSKLDLLNVRPLPQVIFYDDIATAILRMEVVIRLEAMQALVESNLGKTTRPVQHIVNRNSWTAADHSQTEAAVFRAWLEALAGGDQTVQQLEKSPISSPAAAKISFISRIPTWARLVFVTILVVLFAQIDNNVRSSAPTALEHSQTRAGSELDALDYKRANQSAVPLFATNIEESVSGAREGMR
jgi:hypothetical protein